jgi:hypothetical protein
MLLEINFFNIKYSIKIRYLTNTLLNLLAVFLLTHDKIFGTTLKSLFQIIIIN